jgi:uncharacterized spore protein YtfJ
MTMKEKEISWGQLVELVPDAVSKVKSFVDRRSGNSTEPDDTTEEEEADSA